jgi:hypothetical protein
MSEPTIAMPVAVVPEGIDTAAFYATFAGKVGAVPDAGGLVIDLAGDPAIARLHAPLKAAMRFVVAGQVVDGQAAAADTVLLETWPASYLSLRDRFSSPVPTRITLGPVEAQAVRDAVTPLFTALGRSAAAVEQFMTGDGLLRVLAGAAVGAAALAASPSDPARPRRVALSMQDATGQPVNPVQFLAEAADLAGIDRALHPLLNQLQTEGWLEVLALDAAGAPLADTPYALYLFDSSVRTGRTDAAGRIFETGLPPGGWWIDLPEHPAFDLVG